MNCRRVGADPREPTEGRRGARLPWRHPFPLPAAAVFNCLQHTLTPDELERLIAAAAKFKCRLGAIPNRDRTVLYQVVAFTGLRAQELASLTYWRAIQRSR